ncbi:MAG: hypothetical protein U9Q83_02280 [Bacteroidota bacterium]|nr:hypothetical protein [Bacteroidota bacterium]
MNLKYTTGKLHAQLVSLGFLILAIGIWRIIVGDWFGILFIVVSIFIIFTKSVITIDTENKKIKKYNSYIFFKRGKWEDIKTVKSLIIRKVKISQNMHLLSLSKTETSYKYKIIMILANKNTEIITKEDYKTVKKIADEIAKSLDILVEDKT